jgi:hypothetical protein
VTTPPFAALDDDEREAALAVAVVEHPAAPTARATTRLTIACR